MLPSARTVISLGTVYNTARPYSSESGGGDRAAIARYAWGDDYHTVLEGRLDRLVESLRAVAGDGFEARRYVDTGPVQERVYAQYAGLGWIGKNTCLINPELGSWLFLSEIITNLDLDARRAGLRSVWNLHVVPGVVPDRRAGRARRARLDALPVVPHHRDQGSDARRVP